MTGQVGAAFVYCLPFSFHLPTIKGMPTVHEPNKASRDVVRLWTQAGIQQKFIAEYLGITEKTLRKHYRPEIDKATRGNLAAVADRLFIEAKKGNISAAIFIMKTRGGWREADPNDDNITGTAVKVVINPPKYPRDE